MMNHQSFQSLMMIMMSRKDLTIQIQQQLGLGEEPAKEDSLRFGHVAAAARAIPPPIE